jgi:ribosomal protein S18 acetylase RimI-like enzyme
MEIDASLVETSIQAPIGSAILEPDARIIHRENWYQIITPSVKEASVNEVILSRISDSEAPKRIEETFEIYRNHQLPFKWCIGPMANARAIEPRIQPKAQESWDYRGMAVECKMEIIASENVEVSLVTSDNFDQFLEVFLAGWGIENFRESTRARLERISKSDTAFPYFLASIAGTPVGTAGTVLKNGYGYLVGAVVLEEFRGSGAYRALLRERLRDLKDRGMPYAVTHAREATSAPILQKLGFETTFRAKIYKF